MFGTRLSLSHSLSFSPALSSSPLLSQTHSPQCTEIPTCELLNVKDGLQEDGLPGRRDGSPCGQNLQERAEAALEKRQGAVLRTKV